MEDSEFEVANARLTKRLQLFVDASEMLASILPQETAQMLRDDAEQYVAEAVRACCYDAKNFETVCEAAERQTLNLYKLCEERRATITRQLEKVPRGTAH